MSVRLNGYEIRAFKRDTGEPAATLRQEASIWQAIQKICTLHHLDGSWVGCIMYGIYRFRALFRYAKEAREGWRLTGWR